MFRLQPNFVLCLGCSSCLIADSICHGQWHVFGVRHQPPCSGKFAWLGNHLSPSLANRTGASVEVAKARCQFCFSKLCLLFSPFEHRSLQQRQLPKNIYNFGTARYQMPSSKLVLNGDSVVQKGEVAKLYVSTSFLEGFQVCVGEDLAFSLLI